jgi:cobalt-zinc-cadmium efflux system membrane fusion protein
MIKRIGMVLAGVLALGAIGLAAGYVWGVGPWRGGAGAETRAEDRCPEHGVPEGLCTLCHPKLKETLLLCDEHGGVPEGLCTLCHPELKEKLGLTLCAGGHGLPEHFCNQCDAKSDRGASTTGKDDDGWCVTHNRPEELCDLCRQAAEERVDGGLEPAECRQPLPVVRLKTAEVAAQVGIETAAAAVETHAHTLEANAETAFDSNHFAELTPRVAGVLREVRADLGQTVSVGEVLAVVDSPAVGAAKVRWLTSQAALVLRRDAYERVSSLTRADALPGKQELEARTDLSLAESDALEAGQALRNLGFDEADLAKIAEERQASGVLPIASPIAGTVVERHAVMGEAVQMDAQLFSVADTSRAWLWIDVYEADMGSLVTGQTVRFTPSGSNAGTSYEGTITWLGAQVDPTTRTTRVRAEIANPSGVLRANQFGQAVIRIGEPHEVVVVPRSAVQRHGSADVVFLPEGPGLYRPRRIVTKPTDRPDQVEVTWGLKAGEQVVTGGSFWLKTEILKGAIGAGCCE